MQNSKLKSQKLKHSTSKGFTLIELLIVLAIIGVLASLLMVNFVGIRQRARDAQRKSDLRQIQSALEMYRADQGLYPSSLPICGSSLTSPDTSSTYMQKIPCEPLNSPVYSYTGDGKVYALVACLENINDSEKDSTSDAYCGSTTTRWSITLRNP